jgi:hypothetical protein
MSETEKQIREYIANAERCEYIDCEDNHELDRYVWAIKEIDRLRSKVNQLKQALYEWNE